MYELICEHGSVIKGSWCLLPLHRNFNLKTGLTTDNSNCLPSNHENVIGVLQKRELSFLKVHWQHWLVWKVYIYMYLYMCMFIYICLDLWNCSIPICKIPKILFSTSKPLDSPWNLPPETFLPLHDNFQLGYL